MRLDEDIFEFVECVARELGFTRSEAIRRMLRLVMSLDPEKVREKMDELKLE